MTSDPPFDGQITSTEGFEAALGGILQAALDGDVDPNGSWVYRTADATSDLEVMVVELETTDERD